MSDFFNKIYNNTLLLPKSHIITKQYSDELMILRFIDSNYLVRERNGIDFAFFHITDKESFDKISILNLKKHLVIIFGFEPNFIEGLIKYYLKYRHGLNDEQIDKMYNIFRFDWSISTDPAMHLNNIILYSQNNGILQYFNDIA